MTENNAPTEEIPDDQVNVPKANKEARYRTERNEARTERDALAERIERMQTRELERIAAKHLSVPADLLTLSGKTLADLLDNNGDVDPEKVSALAVELLGTRPGLKPVERATDRSQGHGATGGRGTPMWRDLLR